MRSIPLPIRRILDRAAVRRLRARIDRIALARRSSVRALLLADAQVIAAVRELAQSEGIPEAAAWRRAEGYVREIVPLLDVSAFPAIGRRAAGVLLRTFHDVTVEHEGAGSVERPGLPRDAITIHLMNRRSRADRLLVSCALEGRVAISYAAGEWELAFPPKRLCRAFGVCFVRSRDRDRLYDVVLERYVQLVTRRGVTQGIFLEGEPSGDDGLDAPEIGVLDCMLDVARDPAYRDRLFVVPVAVNHDRVPQEQSPPREPADASDAPHAAKWEQTRELPHDAGWNPLRIVARRWRRGGRATVVVGCPLRLAPWIVRHPELFTMERTARLALVRQLGDRVMDRIGALVPVTAVPLAGAATQTIPDDLASRDHPPARIAAQRGAPETVSRRPPLRARASEESRERAR